MDGRTKPGNDIKKLRGRACAGTCLKRGLVKAQDVGAECRARLVARIEHVPARIDCEPEAPGGAVVRHLPEQKLARKIGCHKVSLAVRHESAQVRVERESVAQVAERLR